MQQGNTRIINYPKVESTTTDMLEIKKVELKEDAIVIHFNAYYIPKYWIQINKNVHIPTSVMVSQKTFMTQ